MRPTHEYYPPRISPHRGGVGRRLLDDRARRIGASRRHGPNGKLAIACIGVGGRGADDVQGVKRETLVGLCDVDEKQAGKTFGQFPNVERFVDFRVMLEKVKPLDAVVVATPDHTHAVAAMAAMNLGKHVYCEKPLRTFDH